MANKRSHKSAAVTFANDDAANGRPHLKWTLGGLALVLAIAFLFRRSQQLDDLASFERDGAPILEAAVSWREQHGKLGCPTLSQLVQDDFLPKSAQQGGRRFRILCSADEVHLEKLGDDGHPIAEDALRLNQQTAPQEH